MTNLSNPIVTATVIDLIYERSDWQGSQGVKGGNRRYKSGDYYVKVNGGYGTKFKPSKLTVVVQVSGDSENHDVFIDFWLKNNWGRLTAARLDALLATCPSYIDLEDHGTYYTATDYSLRAWMNDAIQFCA